MASDYLQRQKIDPLKYKIGENIDMIHKGVLEQEQNQKWDNSLIKKDDQPK